MVGASKRSQDVPAPWWLDILKQQGVAVFLVVVWAIYVGVPESQDRRVMMRELQASLQRISEAEVKQAEAVNAMHSFAEETRTFHRDQQQEHKRMLDALKVNPPVSTVAPSRDKNS